MHADRLPASLVRASLCAALCVPAVAQQIGPDYQLDGPPQLIEDQPSLGSLVTGGLVAGDEFGSVIALDGDHAAIGAPIANGAIGVVYLFERASATAAWTYKAEIAPALNQFADFGRSVALDGDALVVGAPGHDNGTANEGSVFVYSFSTQTLSAQLVVPTSAAATSFDFGYDVAIDGGRLVAGDPSAHRASTGHAGAAYVFEAGSSWVLVQEAFASDAAGGDQFGVSVDLQGDYAIVGANANDDPTLGTDSGSAYLFRRTISLTPPTIRWLQNQKLVPARFTPTLGCGFAYFGNDVQIDGTTIAVGAPHTWLRLTTSCPVVCETGSVYLFEHQGVAFPGGTWASAGRLTPSDIYLACPANPPAGANFGYALSLEGDVLAVGAPGRNPGGQPKQGAVYVFHRAPALPTGWAEEAQLVEEDNVVGSPTLGGDRLGQAVALHGETVLAGGSADLSSTGAAFSFRTHPRMTSLMVGRAYVTSGAAQTLLLDAGPSHAGEAFVLYSSEQLLDQGFFYTRLDWNSSVFCCTDGCLDIDEDGFYQGTLDANGKATLTLTFSGACGTTRYYAFVAGPDVAGTGPCEGKQVFDWDPLTGAFPDGFVSDEAAVTFVP